MKDVDTLEAQFKAELLSALRRAASGRARTLFSLKDSRARATLALRRCAPSAARHEDLAEGYRKGITKLNFMVERYAAKP